MIQRTNYKMEDLNNKGIHFSNIVLKLSIIHKVSPDSGSGLGHLLLTNF